jgi:hypothetical protein
MLSFIHGVYTYYLVNKTSTEFSMMFCHIEGKKGDIFNWISKLK